MHCIYFVFHIWGSVMHLSLSNKQVNEIHKYTTSDSNIQGACRVLMEPQQQLAAALKTGAWCFTCWMLFRLFADTWCRLITGKHWNNLMCAGSFASHPVSHRCNRSVIPVFRTFDCFTIIPQVRHRQTPQLQQWSYSSGLMVVSQHGGLCWSDRKKSLDSICLFLPSQAAKIKATDES